MANDYFKFKQFIVQQQKAALKVCTDACILGAFAANYLALANEKAETILDIGTGTGLLSLMLAQKTTGMIDAVEVDDESFNQAKANFIASRWSERLNAIHADINQLKPATKYDVVICNPPFFQNSLLSKHANKNLSKHVDTLKLSQLASIVAGLLDGNGIFLVLLPFMGFDEFVTTAGSENLHLDRRLNISHSMEHPFFRTVGIFTFNKSRQVSTSQLFIKEANVYTKDFNDLLQDYYLYL